MALAVSGAKVRETALEYPPMLLNYLKGVRGFGGLYRKSDCRSMHRARAKKKALAYL